MITILYFAWLRERLGKSEEQLHVPDHVRTVGALIALLCARSAASAEAFAPANRVRAAVNQVFAGLEDAIGPGDEIAFFPPVTGG